MNHAPQSARFQMPQGARGARKGCHWHYYWGVRSRAGPLALATGAGPRQGAFNIKAVGPMGQDLAPWRGQEPGLGSTRLGGSSCTLPNLFSFSLRVSEMQGSWCSVA